MHVICVQKTSKLRADWKSLEKLFCSVGESEGRFNPEIQSIEQPTLTVLRSKIFLFYNTFYQKSKYWHIVDLLDLKL